MDILSHFLAYAADFEKTYADDDWRRLAQYFHDDAVYEVSGMNIDCRLKGPAAIFKGIKKSLDGFDRRFEAREIAVVSGPEVDSDVLRAGWTVTYRKPGLDPFVMRGASEARYRDGKIAVLADAYDARMLEESDAWRAKHALEIDPSYV
jgi:hypothetical protein